MSTPDLLWQAIGAARAHFVELGGVRVEVGHPTLSGHDVPAAASAWAARLMNLGVQPLDRVMVVAHAPLVHVHALLGALAAGVVHVPANPHARTAELTHIATDSGARMLLADEDAANNPHVQAAVQEANLALVRVDTWTQPRHPTVEDTADRLPQAPPTAADAPALLVYTSGTTGPAKGCVHTRASLAAGLSALTEGWQICPADRVLVPLPLYHVHGLGIGVIGSLLQGATALLLPKFTPTAVCEAFAMHGATVLLAVPTQYALLAPSLVDPACAAALRSARLLTAGSAALSPALFARFAEATGHAILERYGMSETLLSLSNPYDPSARVAGSVGYPVAGYEVRLCDERGLPISTASPAQPGELWVRGPGLMTGYWNRPAETAAVLQNGWLQTGDLAQRDPDGRVWILGRISTDLIKSGGYRIAAREIEEALCAHPHIAEAAVIGIPDAVWGERIVAALVLQDDAPGQTDAGWLAMLDPWLRARLADHKRVREVRVLAHLPRTSLGKVQKKALVPYFESPVVRVARSAALDDILPVRHRVLRDGRPLRLARFAGDHDPDTHHFAVYEGPRAVSCASLMCAGQDGVTGWQLRGMATDAHLQGSGVGGLLLQFVHTWLRERHGDVLLWCNARESAARFYARHGWEIVSERFDIPDVGPHFRMRLVWPPPE